MTKCNPFLILCKFESVKSGLIYGLLFYIFKFSSWQIFIIATIYYNRKKSANTINRKLKIIPSFGLLPTRLNIHKNKKIIAFYQISDSVFHISENCNEHIESRNILGHGGLKTHVDKVSGHPSAKCLALAHRRVIWDTPR